ncbi:hypothetical protein O2W15_17755 [Modestobacter sp. VKM Ac-2979]|uniref:hypothetical protein n=1 Tax=unclassified Modestobacter TaxID=2643866 RepID=UPI0022AB67D3|nr:MULTISPECIES: hypothetical protein [unclassified Modestobacter]MCZ2813281.1 hypothetical protein [Modestobacter sp. VKM Ac-2979]MCZ2842527.1 hypothetical protein [Modestobacter sp. VKM Ac-2980]
MTSDSSDDLENVRPIDRAPDNEQPVAGAWNTTLFRSDRVLISAISFEVYSSGISFLLAVRLSEGSPFTDNPHWDEGPEGLHLGVEFQDGRRAELGSRPVASGPLLRFCGGQGGYRSMDNELWLHPVPPSGPMAFIIRCGFLGISETRTTIDATTFSEATSQVIEAWPWAPPARSTSPVGSWFST